jgi:hypothetical protein
MTYDREGVFKEQVNWCKFFKNKRHTRDTAIYFKL